MQYTCTTSSVPYSEFPYSGNFTMVNLWHSAIAVITTGHIYSILPGLWFFLGLNPACSVSEFCGSENLHYNNAKLFWLMKHLRPFVNVSKSNFKNFWTSESLFFFIFSINACPWINKRNLTISGYHTYKWMVLIFHIFNTCNWSSLLTSDVRIRHLSTARKFKWMFTLPAMSVLHLYTITKRKEMYECVNEKKCQSVTQYLLHRYFCISLLLFQLAYLWSNKNLKHESPHKKWSFSLRISSVNVTKSLMENYFLCS